MKGHRKRLGKTLLKGYGALIGILALMLWQSGCAQVLVPGTIAGAGELYRYSTGNIAQQTLVGNPDQVISATQKALKKMNIELTGIDRSDTEAVVSAETAELRIRIELQPVTPTVTRVAVNAAKNHVVKDKATASEILSQIELAMRNSKPPTGHHTRVFIKNGCGRVIRVAVYFQPETEEKKAWQVGGWFSLDPGQRKHAVNTQNRFVYFYAELVSGDRYFWSGKFYRAFKGKDYRFFEVDMGERWIDFTQTFNCPP